MIEFEVFGRPAPQGSKTIMRGRLVESSKYLPAWRKAIAEAATEAQAESDWFSDQPLEMSVIFTLEKPKSVKREQPTVPPDLDKLARAIGDSCTGILYNDDAQIVRLNLIKQYGEPEGAIITIEEL
jgi:Holliday junction resolvase RusA-like endonuclease